MELNITNNASDVPFSSIVQELLARNMERSETKYATYKKMRGTAVIDLSDIETAISLHFNKGSLTIEPGASQGAAILITTSSDRVMDLSALNIRWGLPYYFNQAGRNVLGLILSGKIRIKGLLTHPVLLTHLSIIMSVM